MGKQDPFNKQQSFSKQESTITLKVLIHCEGCKRKVKRIIKCVDGVDSVNIDAEYGKVTVVGTGVDAREVLDSLHKAGKHAEIWHFGGGGGGIGKVHQPNAANMANNNANGEKNKMKAVGFEKQPQEKNTNNKTNTPTTTFPKGKGSNENPMHGGMGANMGGANYTKGGEMLELANAGPSFLMPPPKPPFPMGGFTPSGHFDKPNLPTNNHAILSKSVAPRPSIFHGETSFSPLDHNSESATAEYATHMFSDENANSCSVM